MAVVAHLSEADLRTLPPVVSVAVAADALGICRQSAYDLIRRDRFPVPTLRLGKQLRIPTAPLLELLQISRDTPDVSRLPGSGDEVDQGAA